jgi:hypothetical protein
MAVFYISSSGGSDANSGTSETTAWATLSKITAITAGDTVYLKRGDTWYEPFPTIPSTAGYQTWISTYGTGANPVVSGYKTVTGAWTNTGGNVWKIDITNAANYTGLQSTNTDVGFLKVDGVIYGYKFSTLGGIVNQWDFYSDAQYLYVYSTSNPAGSTVQFTVDVKLLLIRSYSSIYNIDLQGTGGHGAAAQPTTTKSNLIGMKISEIGGSYLDGYGSGTTRYGNAIQFGGGMDTAEVTGCTISDVYDAAFTSQGSTGTDWKNIWVHHNYITRCTQAFEHWCTNASAGFFNNVIENNICTNTGYGWGYDVRPDKDAAVPILFYEWTVTSSDITFRNNVFFKSRKGLYYSLTYNQSGTFPAISSYSNNIFLQEGQNIISSSYPVESSAAFVTATGKEKKSNFYPVAFDVQSVSDLISLNQAFLSANAAFQKSLLSQIGNNSADIRNSEAKFDRMFTTVDLFWDATNKRLGMGTNTPQSPLHLYISSNTYTQFQAGSMNMSSTNSNTPIYDLNSQGGANILRGRKNTVATFDLTADGKMIIQSTITATGTTGNQTINKPTGTVNIAAAGTSVIVTNNLVTASSIVYCVIRKNDTNSVAIKSVVPAAGSFTINLTTAPAAEISIGFIVFN